MFVVAVARVCGMAAAVVVTIVGTTWLMNKGTEALDRRLHIRNPRNTD